MSRTARLNYPGGLFHVISRFTGGSSVIKGGAERGAYLRLLGQSLGRTNAQLLAYCMMSDVVMSTHVHLVVIQGDEPLERLFKPTHTGFAMWVKRRRRKKVSGSLFAERPRSLLVDSDEYLLELVRYVHNNPVRAGLYRRASASDWSSHQAYIGRVEAAEWLNVGHVLERFSKRTAHAQRAFDAFVREGQREGHRPEFSGAPDSEAIAEARRVLGDSWPVNDPVLGSKAFARRVLRDISKAEKALSAGALASRGGSRSVRPMVRDVVDAILTLFEIEPWEFEERPKARTNILARQLLVWVWVRHFGGAQVDISRELRVDSSRVARWYGRAMAIAPDLERNAGGAFVANTAPD